MKNLYQDRLALLLAAQARTEHTKADLGFLRSLAFLYKCRSAHAAEMIADLIPIYTIKAIAEKLTT